MNFEAVIIVTMRFYRFSTDLIVLDRQVVLNANGYDCFKRKDKLMYAIVETGGKQYQVEEGRYVDIEMLEDAPESKVVFTNIVMLVNGKKSKVGQPYVANASVEGVVVKHDRKKKVLVYKQRAKKGYRKKQGHRQSFTRVMINKIRTSAQKAKAEAATEE